MQTALATDTETRPQIKLRPYQREAVDAIKEALDHGVARPAIQLPTGLGKTIVFGALAKEVGYPALVLAHRDELLDQAADKIRTIDPGVSVGKVKAAQNEWWADVVVASVQTVSREKRLAELATLMRTRGFKLAIIDEAHHAPAATYQAVMSAITDAGVPILGVSATLERGDGSGLGGAFDQLVYERDMVWGIEQGYLVDLRGVRVRLKDAEFGRIKVSRGDFQDGAAARVLHDAGAPAYVVQAFQQHAAGRKAIVFTPTVALAAEMADAFRKVGIAADHVSGDTPTVERKDIIRRLRSGETRVVCNAMVLTEGFDEPSVDCVIVARPTLSRSLYVQMVGRGTRLYPGKSDCVVIDLVGASDRLKLVTIPNLFDLPTEWQQDGSMTVGQALVKQAEEEQGELRLREIEAERVDLFTQRKFNWVREGHRFILTTGDGFVILADSGSDTWGVMVEPRRGDPELLATGLDLGYAQGIAEDFVRKAGAAVLNDRNARWRSGSASERQVAALRKWGVVPPDGITKGEASDLLTETIAARKAKTDLLAGVASDGGGAQPAGATPAVTDGRAA